MNFKNIWSHIGLKIMIPGIPGIEIQNPKKLDSLVGATAVWVRGERPIIQKF